MDWYGYVIWICDEGHGFAAAKIAALLESGVRFCSELMYGFVVPQGNSNNTYLFAIDLNPYQIFFIFHIFTLDTQ